MRRFSRLRAVRQDAQATVSLTPLIDTALTLLVIFMIATPMMHRAIKVELPRGTVDEFKKERQQKDITVYIDSNEYLFLNGEKIVEGDLAEALQKLTADSQQEVVVVKADTSISYGRVVALVDTLKKVKGVVYVALATQKPRS